MAEAGKDDEASAPSASVEVDSFLRAVARVPPAAPQGAGVGGPAQLDLTGRTLLHFHVVERLGAGGMGVVYRAVDEKLRRPVALKVLSARWIADAGHRETLLREARAAAAVSHPNIAAIHEVHEGSDGAFFVMELVEGETLRARLARAGPLPLPEALRVAVGIAQGLARAHASGVVHRDLKCDNVMLTPDGHPKLLDFGLATVPGVEEGAETTLPTDAHGAALALAPTMPVTATPTTGGRVAGTPASMSPEQARGDRVDARADVYGFGVVLYEMLSAQAPFSHRRRRPWEWGDETSAAWTPGRPLRELAPRVPRQVYELVARCLAYAPDARPRDGAALIEQIEACRAPPSRRGAVVAAVVTVAALASVGALGAVAVGRRSWDAAPGASASSAVAPPSAPEPLLRALTTDSASTFDGSWFASSVSGDLERVLYIGVGVGFRSCRVHDLRTEADEMIPSPDGADIVSALFLGEGPSERIALQTTRATWSVRPDTKQATKILDDPLQYVTMSADGSAFEWLRLDSARGVGVFGRTDTASGVAKDVGETREIGDPPEFWLSPDGSLLASVDRCDTGSHCILLSRSDAPGDAHVVLVDGRLQIGLDYVAINWIAGDRLVLSLQEGDPPTTNLWQLRIDPVALRALGPLEPLTHWEHVIAVRLHMHGARHAISFSREETQADVSLARLAPGTRRVSDPRRLTLSDADQMPGAWTADGRDLVFTSNHSGRWGIYVRAAADGALERPVVTGPVTSSWPQLALGDTALLYWSVPQEGPPSLMRVPFPSTNAPAEVLFVSPDRERRTWDAPLPVLSRFVCARRAPDCVLLSYDSTASAWTWYHLDPRDGGRRPLEGLPAPDAGAPNIQLSPDGQRLAVADADEAVAIFALAPQVRPLANRPSTFLGAFDADSRGLFLSPIRTLEWAPTLAYLREDGGLSEVSRPNRLRPVVSPDGSQMAFLSHTERRNVWVVEHAF